MHQQFKRSKGLEDPLDAQLNAELTSALKVTTHGRSDGQLKQLADAFKIDTARALMKELQALQGMKTEKEPALDGILNQCALPFVGRTRETQDRSEKDQNGPAINMYASTTGTSKITPWLYAQAIAMLRILSF